MTEDHILNADEDAGLLEDPAELQKRIDDALARSRRVRAYNLYKSSLRQDLSANEREILLWRAKEVLLGLKDATVEAVMGGAMEEVQYSNSIDKERMDFFWVPLQSFGRRAFSSLTLTQLYSRIRSAWSQAEAEFGKFALPVPPAGTNPNTLAFLIKKLDEIAGTHYAIVAGGLSLYVLLERLRDQHNAFTFLQAASQLAALLIQYAAHEPRNSLPLEEEGVEALGAIQSIITTVQDFVESGEFTGQKGMAPGTTPAPRYLAAAARVFASLAEKTPAGKVMQVDAKKGDRGARVFAITVADVNIDVSEARSPATVLEDISDLFGRLLHEQGLAISSVRSSAMAINYNINTNEWGSVAAGSEHVLRMEAIRAKIFKYMKIDAEVLVPRIYLKQYFRLVYLRGGLLPGEVQYSDTLLPNLKVSIRTSTKQFTKQTLTDSQNFTQSADATQREQLDTKVEAEQNKRQEDSTSTNKYKNTTENFNVGGSVGYTMGIPSIPLGGGGGQGSGAAAPAASAAPAKPSSPPMSSNQGLNASFNIGYTNNKAEGTSTDTNRTREDTQRTLNSAQTSLLNEKKVTQSKTVAASAERVTEETAENTQTRDYQNPNRASCLRLDFVNLMRKIFCCYVIYDVKVFFSNGVASTEVDIPHLQNLLDQVLAPEDQAPGVRQGLYEEVIKACRVVDYGRRVVSLLDEAENPPAIRPDDYFTLLSEKGHVLDSRDRVLMQCAPYLRGVVWAVDEFLVPLDATTFVARATETALDKNEQRDFEIELGKRNADKSLRDMAVMRAALDMDNIKKMVSFIENYNPSNPEEVKAKGDLFFKLIKESGHILNAVTLEGFFKQAWGPGGNEGGDGKNLAEVARRLGIR